MKMTSFAPEEFFEGGPNWCPQKDAYRKTRFSSITRLELRSVERNKSMYHINVWSTLLI